MKKELVERMRAALGKIDRPNTFCAQGSVPVGLPGLEVEGVGPIGLPLSAKQAGELKAVCERAPYGKGTQTLVDTKVRRVWRLAPERFTLANPDWNQLVDDMVSEVQAELGLEKQEVVARLYDLLLYEKGSFFLPHKDGEKHDGMVATLVVVLPSEHEGGELVVRHDGREEVCRCGGGEDLYRIYFVGFYTDCEHEVRPLQQGHRLCLVYNLMLAKRRTAIRAPRTTANVEGMTKILEVWGEEPAAGKLAITLEHEYTEKGIDWDTLKGADRGVAEVLAAAAKRAHCRAYLGLLTLWEMGSGHEVGGSSYRYGRRYDYHDKEREDEEDAEYQMEEVIESSLSAQHCTDRAGKRMAFDELSIEESELLDPDALRAVKPQEEFEGFTGNAGMTLDRWYRHGAIILWPEKYDFEIACDQSLPAGVAMLKKMVAKWSKAAAGRKAKERAELVRMTRAILARWPENPYGPGYGQTVRSDDLFGILVALDDVELIHEYLGKVMLKNAGLDPGKALASLCRKYGVRTFENHLHEIFKNTTAASMPRNIQVLEHLAAGSTAKDEDWDRLCAALAEQLLAALQTIDGEGKAVDWRLRYLDRKVTLADLVRALTTAGQSKALATLIRHVLSLPDKYPLVEVQLGALTALQGWLKKKSRGGSEPLRLWVEECRQQLEELTAAEPQEPTDFARPASAQCKCKDCQELNRFLADAGESVHRFMAPQHTRSHLEQVIQSSPCDVDVKTERTRPSHTLVCTKNIKSFHAAVKKYGEDLRRLGIVRGIESSLAK